MAKDKAKSGEGVGPDGSDLHVIGVQAVYGETGTEFNMRDPRQVAERLKARKARKERQS